MAVSENELIGIEEERARVEDGEQATKEEGGGGGGGGEREATRAGALSDGAARLLGRASRSVGKRRLPASRSCARSLMAELQSLKKMLPNAAATFEGSCIIRAALDYVQRMETEVAELQGGPGSPTDVLERALQPSIKVAVSRSGQRLDVHVSCPKRPSLLADLMVVLEGAGLVLDHVNASCSDDRLLFEASSTTTSTSSSSAHEQEVDPSSLKYDLLVITHARCLE